MSGAFESQYVVGLCSLLRSIRLQLFFTSAEVGTCSSGDRNRQTRVNDLRSTTKGSRFSRLTSLSPSVLESAVSLLRLTEMVADSHGSEITFWKDAVAMRFSKAADKKETGALPSLTFSNYDIFVELQ